MNKTYELFKNRDFFNFWMARTISRIGDNFALVAIAIYATRANNSAKVMSILLIAQLTPQLFSPLAGIIVDSRSPKGIMILCDTARFILFTLFFFSSTDNVIAPAIYIGLASLFSTLFNPAGRSILPDIVAKEDITKANSILSIGANAGMALGPIIAGIMALKFDYKILFLINAASFVISMIFVLYMQGVNTSKGRYSAITVFKDLKTAISYKQFRAVSANLFIVAFFGSICHASLIFYNDKILKGDSDIFGILTAVYGIGMVIFPAFVLNIRKLAPEKLIAISIILLSVSTSLMALAPIVLLAVIMRFFMGGGNGWLNIANDSYVQMGVPKEDLGKVFGSIFFFPSLSSILALFINPILLKDFSPDRIYFISGILTLVAILPMMLFAANPKSQNAHT